MVQYIVGPILLAAVTGYAAVRTSEGSTQHRLEAAESAITEQKKDNKDFTTRQEFNIYNELTSRELREIHEDVRAIRRAVETK